MLTLVIVGQSVALLWFSCLLYATRHRVRTLEQDGVESMLGAETPRLDELADSLETNRADLLKFRKDLEALTGRVAELASLSLAESPDAAKIREDLELKTKQIDELYACERRTVKARESFLADLSKQIDNAVALSLYRASVATKSKD
jgi:hypothetical protein